MSDGRRVASNPDLGRTARIVAAYVANNSLRQSDLNGLVVSVFTALTDLRSPPVLLQPPPVPAVPIRKSVTPSAIICREDGKKFKSMKRHLARLGFTPDQYRTKWGLPADYPMVAPDYTALRSRLAISNGLGRGRASGAGRSRKPKKSATPL